MKLWKGTKKFFNRINLAIDNYRKNKKQGEKSEIEKLKRKEKLLKQKAKVRKAEDKLKEKNKGKGMFDTTEDWGLSIGNQDTIGLNKVIGGKNG